jgi:kynurenine formamidase
VSWEFELVDLSRPITEQTAVGLFGDLLTDAFGRVDVEFIADWSNANGCVARFSVFDHIATHMDAPSHTNEDGVTLEHVDITRLIGEAVVLDLVPDGEDHGYTADELAAATPEIEPGDIVLIHSGFREVASTDERMHQTYLTVEAAQWLVDRGVKAVGCEPAGIEHLPDGNLVHRWYAKDTPNPPSWPAHRVLLGNDVYIVEGLTNLDRIKGRRVRFAALPLLFPGLTGSPVRAVAWVER